MTIIQRAIGIQNITKISHSGYLRILMTSTLSYNKVLGHLASGADTDHVGLISICRANTDPYHTLCGTPLVSSFRIRLKFKAMIHTLQTNV